VHVEPGEPTSAAACLRTDPKISNALLDDPALLDAAMSDGRVVATGDLSALRCLLRSATTPTRDAG
jgi:hypothetical protein